MEEVECRNDDWELMRWKNARGDGIYSEIRFWPTALQAAKARLDTRRIVPDDPVLSGDAIKYLLFPPGYDHSVFITEPVEEEE